MSTPESSVEGPAVGRLTTLYDLSPLDAAERIVREARDDWTRRFVDELDRRVRARPLERFAHLWGLSGAAAARVFGVSRQAFAKWLDSGPPVDRAVAIADLAAATDLLDRHVKRDRIPAVVRRHSASLGGRSLLEVATDGDTRLVLLHVREMLAVVSAQS